MIFQIHREYVNADYTISRVTYAGGEFALLEPPLVGITLKGPHGLIPQQNKLFVKRIGTELCPCLPRCGRNYLQRIQPLYISTRGDEADFTPKEGISPVYFGRLTDDGLLDPDMPGWKEFYNRVVLNLKTKERIQLHYS